VLSYRVRLRSFGAVASGSWFEPGHLRKAGLAAR